jgi:hypothetical protein
MQGLTRALRYILYTFDRVLYTPPNITSRIPSTLQLNNIIISNPKKLEIRALDALKSGDYF